jgi:hypothetical protein
MLSLGPKRDIPRELGYVLIVLFPGMGFILPVAVKSIW